MQIEYKAIKVQQQPNAPPFYLLKVTAEDLLRWADVPRKRDAYLAGYQRELDDRHKNIKQFLEQDPRNIIPGAIVVALRSNAAIVTPDKAAEGLYDIAIDFDEGHDFESLLKRTFEVFRLRLNKEEAELLEKVEEAEDNDDVTAEQDDEDDADDDSRPPPSYLATLTAELQDALRDFSSLPEDRQEAVRDYVIGTAKPGLIIDGQHRAFGAKEVTANSVELAVVLLPDMDVGEQVFHFYVLNNKAKPLKPTQLRSTVSTSLSRKEIDDLYHRFRLAGVKTEEAQWTHRINTDENSPFKGMVDFGFGGANALIDENVMFQIASKFLRPAKKYKLLFSEIEPWQSDDTEFKLSMFYAFWGAVKTKYPNAWSTKVGDRQIFMKVAMLCLQDYLFLTFNKAMPSRMNHKQLSPFADENELTKEVDAALHFLPEEFFTKKWTEPGLDTNRGRDFLLGQMEAAINNQGQKLGTLQLFKAKKSAKGK